MMLILKNSPKVFSLICKVINELLIVMNILEIERFFKFHQINK